MNSRLLASYSFSFRIYRFSAITDMIRMQKSTDRLSKKITDPIGSGIVM